MAVVAAEGEGAELAEEIRADGEFRRGVQPIADGINDGDLLRGGEVREGRRVEAVGMGVNPSDATADDFLVSLVRLVGSTDPLADEIRDLDRGRGGGIRVAGDVDVAQSL